MSGISPTVYYNTLASNISVCLLPAKSSAENIAIQKIIDDVATKHGKSTFLPHATLAILPATVDAEDVVAVIRGMKEEIFTSSIIFEEMEISPVGFAILGKKDEHLIDLQKRFHDKLQASPNVAAFPHVAVAYTESGQLETLRELEEKGLYKKKTDRDEAEGGIELAGYDRFKVGGLYAAYCGGFDPAKWNFFLRMDEEDGPDN